MRMIHRRPKEAARVWSAFPKSVGADLGKSRGLCRAVWLFVALTPLAFATNRYVATTGSNTPNCANSASPCLTIGYTISQSSSGDTINVAAGTYNEQVTITQTLTFPGAQHGIDARTRSGAESIITNTCGPV